MRSISSIIFKDVIVEMRSKESISSMLMFGILILVVFNVRVRIERRRQSADCSGNCGWHFRSPRFWA